MTQLLTKWIFWSGFRSEFHAQVCSLNKLMIWNLLKLIWKSICVYMSYFRMGIRIWKTLFQIFAVIAFEKIMNTNRTHVINLRSEKSIYDTSSPSPKVVISELRVWFGTITVSDFPIKARFYCRVFSHLYTIRNVFWRW